MSNPEYDAVVVGSGPNGLAAAITLQQAGLSVMLLEAKSSIGGGMRTEALTLPGFRHDVCSAIHPMALESPFFQSLPLESYGLEWILPPVSIAHPMKDGSATLVYRSLKDTARELGIDEEAFLQLMQPMLDRWPKIKDDILGPFHFPRHPMAMAGFGLKALASASSIAKRFQTPAAKALWAGMAAHSMIPLDKTSSAAIGLVLLTAAHMRGWPMAKGGSSSIADALSAYFVSLGGKIETNCLIQKMEQIPSAKAILFDLTPRQLLSIAGDRLSAFYKWQLNKYRYGMGAFKIDWALEAPIPFAAADCRQAGTIHIGASIEEISNSESQAWKGNHTDQPFVLLSQQSLFDPSRAPAGKQTAWAYCHTPNGSTKDMTLAIEQQVERFAPGFRKLIMARHTMNTAQLEAYNPNYVGGDINGGAIDIGQLFTRPALRSSPYRSSAKGLYLCSSATPPGGGVHGMCGWHAAKKALSDVFHLKR
jgi:phytoene dehydrogenase-like protein